MSQKPESSYVGMTLLGTLESPQSMLVLAKHPHVYRKKLKSVYACEY